MITSLELRNFKCFKQQVLQFSRLTLLSGLNGMGKSSVLQALLLLRQSFRQGTLPSTGVTLNGELLSLGTAKDVLYQDALEDELEIGVQFDHSMRARFLMGYDRDADVLSLRSDEIEKKFFEGSLFSDDFHYVQAERLGPRVASDVSDYMVRHRRQIGPAGEYAAHYLATFGDDRIPLPQLAYPGTDSLLLRHQVEAWLGEISPGVRLKITPHPEMDSVNLQYSFTDGTVRTGTFARQASGSGSAILFQLSWHYCLWVPTRWSCSITRSTPSSKRAIPSRQAPSPSGCGRYPGDCRNAQRSYFEWDSGCGAVESYLFPGYQHLLHGQDYGDRRHVCQRRVTSNRSGRSD